MIGRTSVHPVHGPDAVTVGTDPGPGGLTAVRIDLDYRSQAGRTALGFDLDPSAALALASCLVHYANDALRANGRRGAS